MGHDGRQYWASKCALSSAQPRTVRDPCHSPMVAEVVTVAPDRGKSYTSRVGHRQSGHAAHRGSVIGTAMGNPDPAHRPARRRAHPLAAHRARPDPGAAGGSAQRLLPAGAEVRDRRQSDQRRADLRDRAQARASTIGYFFEGLGRRRDGAHAAARARRPPTLGDRVGAQVRPDRGPRCPRRDRGAGEDARRPRKDR